MVPEACSIVVLVWWFGFWGGRDFSFESDPALMLSQVGRSSAHPVSIRRAGIGWSVVHVTPHLYCHAELCAGLIPDPQKAVHG